MNLEKERELFKQAYINLRSGSNIPFPDAVFDEYLILRAKEGYKLAPTQATNKIMVAIESKVEKQLQASGISQDPFRLDGETIYEAMLGAVE